MLNVVEKRYWFVRKKYGYGWEPKTWEGWTSLLVFTLLLGLLGLLLMRPPVNAGKVILFVCATFGLAALLILLCIRFGEAPRWTWGDKDQNKPS